jgi:hypothetical protein
MQRREALHGWLERNHRRSLAASLGFVVIAGVAYCLSLRARIRYADEADYVQLATNLAKLHRYTLDGQHASAYRPPGWPFFLGALKWLGSPIWLMRCTNVLFLAVVVACAWWLALTVRGRAAAALAAPLTALYPIGFYTMGTLYPQTLGAALFLGALVAVVGLASSSRPYARAAVAGLAFGLLVLTIPSFAVALAIVVVWFVVREHRWVPALVLVVVSAVFPLLWTARNYHTFHTLIPVSTNNGINLLLGNSEHAGPRTGVNVDLSSYTHEIDRRHLDEVAADRYMRSAAEHWITTHPVRAGRLFVEKTVNYFAPYDQLGTNSESSGLEQLLAVLTYGPLLLLFVLRLVWWRRYPPNHVERLLILLYLVFAPVEAIFFTRVRFRYPLDPLLLIVVAGLVAAWLVPRPAGVDDSERSVSARTSS